MNGQTQNQNAKQGFNVVATGIGYLNPSYIVTPKKGEPYRCVKVTLVEGLEGDNYLYFDLAVSSNAEATLDYIEQLVQEVGGDDPKVFAAVRIGMKGINTYTRQNGEIGASYRGRLIKVTSVSINGEKFELPGDESGEEESQEIVEQEQPRAAPRASRQAPENRSSAPRAHAPTPAPSNRVSQPINGYARKPVPPRLARAQA